MENLKNIKILLIGCGYWGKNWYKTIFNSQFELAGVVDPSPLIEVDVPLFSSLNEVNVDFTHAILAVNASLHTELVSKLDIPKQNILVEKPCGTNLNDALNINDTFPGLLFLYSEEYSFIKQNLHTIGEPKYWHSIRASMGPRVRTDVSIVEDYLIHDLYIFLDLFGPGGVVSSTLTSEFKPPVKPSSINLLLESKIPGHFFSSWHYPDKVRKIVISGTKGSFIWEDDVLYFDNTNYCGTEVVGGSRKRIDTSAKSNLELELEAFIGYRRPEINIVDLWKFIEAIK